MVVKFKDTEKELNERTSLLKNIKIVKSTQIELTDEAVILFVDKAFGDKCEISGAWTCDDVRTALYLALIHSLKK